MGEVYRARDTRLGRDVAIKVLPGGIATDASRVAPGSSHRVSLSGGTLPKWSHDGSRIYFFSPDGWIMEAPVSRQRGDLAVGTPVRAAPGSGSDFMPSADGQRFLLIEEPPRRPLVLVNWRSLLVDRSTSSMRPVNAPAASSEERVLLECSRGRLNAQSTSTIAALIAGGLDWTKLITLALHHRVAPALLGPRRTPRYAHSYQVKSSRRSSTTAAQPRTATAISHPSSALFCRRSQTQASAPSRSRECCSLRCCTGTWGSDRQETSTFSSGKAT